MSNHYIFNPPPPAPATSQTPYGQNGQPAYGQHNSGGYPHASTQHHQHRGVLNRGGGHQYSAGRSEYPQASAPEYYQVQYSTQSHAPPGTSGYGQWPSGQYHQTPGHVGPPAPAAPSHAAAYPGAPYGSQPQVPYGTGQQSYGHPHASYTPYSSSAVSYGSPAPLHDQGPRPPSGYPGDRNSRSGPPTSRPPYETPAPSNGSYGHHYPSDNRLPPYGAPAPYPAFAVGGHTAFAPVAHSFTSRHDSGHNRRGRGGSQNSGGRGGKFHQSQHNNDRSRQVPNRNSSGPAVANGNGPSSSDAALASKKKKRKMMDPLGLKGTGADATDEDDEDDEARLAKTLGNDGIAFPEDMATWLANRKRNYPTKARIAEKAAAEAERKAAEEAEEAKRREKEAEAKELERKASELRKQLKKVETSIKRKREQHDDGDDMRDSEPESDDDEPEAMSSRAPDAASAPKADVKQPCKYFSTGATCGKGSKCRFVHDQAARDEALREKAANGDKHTIRQRLVLNDKNLEDMDILESIVFLRDRGVEGAESRVKTLAKQQQEQEQSLPKLQTISPLPHSSLPAKPPTLPEKPIKRDAFHHGHHNNKKDPGNKRGHGFGGF